MNKDEVQHQRTSFNQDKDYEGLFFDMKEALHRLENKEQSFIAHLRMHHKISFAFLVFFAINLLWYGMWGIVESIPFLRNPVVSLVLGAIILIATGYFYENLISASFNRSQRKKKEAHMKKPTDRKD